MKNVKMYKSSRSLYSTIWLSQEDAGKLLKNFPNVEQARRDGLLEDFCAKMIGDTEILSFVMRGRKKPDRVSHFQINGGVKELLQAKWWGNIRASPFLCRAAPARLRVL